MTSYEHFFWNYALFFRKAWAWKVGLGGVFPDLVYILPFAPRMLSYGSFMEWMRDPLWDSIWNSPIAKSAHSFLVLFAISLLILTIPRREIFRWLFPFILGWGLHILFDAFTHVSDGYALFYPFSSFRFEAPLSYWEEEYYAREYFWISHSLMVAFFILWLVWIIRRLKSKGKGPFSARKEPKSKKPPACLSRPSVRSPDDSSSRSKGSVAKEHPPST